MVILLIATESVSVTFVRATESAEPTETCDINKLALFKHRQAIIFKKLDIGTRPDADARPDPDRDPGYNLQRVYNILQRVTYVLHRFVVTRLLPNWDTYLPLIVYTPVMLVLADACMVVEAFITFLLLFMPSHFKNKLITSNVSEQVKYDVEKQAEQYSHLR